MIDRNEEQSLTEKANAAFEIAALDVVELAKRTGTPVVIWQDGQVKHISPEELESSVIPRPMDE